MGLFDSLIAAGAVAFFIWIIFAGMAKKNPNLVPMIKSFLEDKKQKKIKEPIERIEQVYDSRSMM